MNNCTCDFKANSEYVCSCKPLGELPPFLKLTSKYCNICYQVVWEYTNTKLIEYIINSGETIKTCSCAEILFDEPPKNDETIHEYEEEEFDNELKCDEDFGEIENYMKDLKEANQIIAIQSREIEIASDLPALVEDAFESTGGDVRPSFTHYVYSREQIGDWVRAQAHRMTIPIPGHPGNKVVYWLGYDKRSKLKSMLLETSFKFRRSDIPWILTRERDAQYAVSRFHFYTCLMMTPLDNMLFTAKKGAPIARKVDILKRDKFHEGIAKRLLTGDDSYSTNRNLRLTSVDSLLMCRKDIYEQLTLRAALVEYIHVEYNTMIIE